MGGLDLAVSDLLALARKAVGRQIALVDEVQIGQTDRTGLQLLQPGAVVQSVRQLNHQ